MIKYFDISAFELYIYIRKIDLIDLILQDNREKLMPACRKIRLTARRIKS
jgi:hypothetical protein